MVSVEDFTGVSVIWIDNPPVNALSHTVREGIFNAIVRLDADQAVRGIVIACRGRTFVAGADIREFGRPVQTPTAREVMARIESSGKPVVAALHGTVLGGGLELALACHYRVALSDTLLGLPEVKLGLLPGAGGTQRLPRLMGVTRALDAMLTGESFNASEALSHGVVDETVPEDVVAAAVNLASRVAALAAPLRRISEQRGRLDEVAADHFEAARQTVAKRYRGLLAPQKIISCVEAAVQGTFEAGMAFEQAAFLELRSGRQSAALRHVFFTEREAAKVPGVAPETIRRPVKHVGVVGAGTMGGGIAMNFLNAGLTVALVDATPAALERGVATILGNYERTAARGKLLPADITERMALLSPTLHLEDVADCDLVIEAVFEDLSLKQELFGKLDRIVRPGALLATNTSYLDVDVIAASTQRPQDVLGLHFFSPANVMRLLEVVRGKQTSSEVIATAMSLARTIGKVPVLVGVCHGFVGNRMLTARRNQAFSLIQEGAMPWDVDRVLEDFGMPMGPFAMTDLAGLDVGWSPATSRGDTVLRDRLCELGRRGQKTGAGYYRYEEKTRARSVDPAVAELVTDYARKSGLPQRHIDDTEILERCLYSIVNEGAKILAEGIALRAGDIDTVWINGYGWPKHTGGPMFWADGVGLKHVLERVRHYDRELGGSLWQPAPLLETLGGAGRTFND